MSRNPRREIIVIPDEAPAASGRGARRQEDPARPRYERPALRNPGSATSPRKSTSPTAVKSPSARPQLAHGSSPLDVHDRVSPSSHLSHRSVQSIPHPIVEARKQQQNAVALRLYKEHLRKEQDELAEAIERSLEQKLDLTEQMSDDVLVVDSDEEVLSDNDVIDMTVGGSMLPVRGPAGAASVRKDRRKQERRVSKIEDRIRELEAEEDRVAEFEDMQTALALSLTQEERDKEAAERKSLLEEQHAAYVESLAKDKAREEEEKRVAEEKRRVEEAEQQRIEAEEVKRRKLTEDLQRAAAPEEEVGLDVADAIDLVLRLPDGKREALRFSRTATIGAVARAAVRLGMPAGTFDLMTDFPRKVFTDYSRLLTAEGLTQRALLSIRLRTTRVY